MCPPDTFNLSPFEGQILLMCAGMAILPNATALFANAQGNDETYFSGGKKGIYQDRKTDDGC